MPRYGAPAIDPRGHTAITLSHQERQTLLLVANYKPDVGYAWWLMENFWVQAAEIGRARGLAPLLVYPEPGHRSPTRSNVLISQPPSSDFLVAV